MSFMGGFASNNILLHNKYLYASNFEEVEEAYWFGPVRLLRFAYGQERLEIGF